MSGHPGDAFAGPLLRNLNPDFSELSRSGHFPARRFRPILSLLRSANARSTVAGLPPREPVRGGTRYGEYFAHRRGRRARPLPCRNPPVPDAGAAAGIYARQALART
ncbi:hypothetical protein QNA11_10045 [Methylocystis sp. JR02]|nr:hypothetical protein [Methylocystis sp. JR02]MDJ0448977.1 hypothetical protein [Methylocystis sp. JR02]